MANGVTWNNGPSGTVTTTLGADTNAKRDCRFFGYGRYHPDGRGLSEWSLHQHAEIAGYTSAITDTLGGNLPDADSNPDTEDTETAVKDDVIDEDGKANPGVDDEDDHDPATITVLSQAQFGDRVWIESDRDGLANTGVITPVVGLVITATGTAPGGTDVFTTTTNSNGYYSFTVMSDTYTVTYGTLPVQYGTVVPSESPGGNRETGSAGTYAEQGDPDMSHADGTTVTLLAGEANWHVDFAFTAPLDARLAVKKTLNGFNPFQKGDTISYTIRITNTGNVTITVLPLEDRYSNVFIEFRNASVTPDVDQPGLLTWNDLTTALGNVGPGNSVSLTVAFEAMADTTLLLPLAPCTSNGHTPNIVNVDGAMADPDGDDGTGDDIAVIKDGDDEDCAEAQILNPTAVRLAETAVSQTSAGVLVQWATLTEQDLAGFRLYRLNGTDVVEVDMVEVDAVSAASGTQNMIPAKNAGQSSGATYRMLHSGATLTVGDTYVLEIVMTNNSLERSVIDVIDGDDVIDDGNDENIYLPLSVW